VVGELRGGAGRERKGVAGRAVRERAGRWISMTISSGSGLFSCRDRCVWFVSKGPFRFEFFWPAPFRLKMKIF